MSNVALQHILYNNQLLIQAVHNGNVSDVKQLLCVSNPKANDNQALCLAAEKGLADIVALLLPVSDTYAFNTALHITIEEGHIECVKLLLPVSDQNVQKDLAWQWAAHSGQIEIVNYLLSNAMQIKNNSWALIAAAINGHADVVKLLLPVLSAKLYDSEALLSATFHKHIDCIKLLIPFSNCNSVIQQMQEDHCDTTLLQEYIEEYENLQQKERLTGNLDAIFDNKNNAIKRKL